MTAVAVKREPAHEDARRRSLADAIVRLCGAPRIELFARTVRPGFDCWGNESNHFAGNSGRAVYGSGDAA